MSATSIVWFRNDLRIADNPALLHAVAGGRVLPVYIVDNDNAGEFALGGASRCWLHHSLQSLNADLNGHLSLYRGQPLQILTDLITRFKVTAIHWNRCYTPWQIKRDTAIKRQLTAQGIEVNSYNASLLWEPWQIHKADGTPYKVFTPFYRNGCLAHAPPREPLPTPKQAVYRRDEKALPLTALDLLPDIAWDSGIQARWRMGEEAAHDALSDFINTALDGYKQGRDFPAKAQTSKLSPHLHFGEISPHQVWHTVRHLADGDDVAHFCSELAWREFSYSLLYYHPTLAQQNLQAKFDRFAWRDDDQVQAHLRAWQQGKTGIPIIDAGMRELWQTGYMHNRVRMLVGSFLVKNLRLHWQYGERWFWDCLVDADLANNSASWQWIAGCGADAAPYFRIFNPVTQSEKFDSQGHYIRRYVPELRQLPDKYLFSPWTADAKTLQQADVVLGTTYPAPLVDLKLSRQQALSAFQALKDSQQ